MHRKPGVILNPQYGNLKTELSNWFSQEILYLEKKLHLSIIPLHGKTENPKQKASIDKEKIKVLCILSTDRTGLEHASANASMRWLHISCNGFSSVGNVKLATLLPFRYQSFFQILYIHTNLILQQLSINLCCINFRMPQHVAYCLHRHLLLSK